jgi:hypothetical protein
VTLLASHFMYWLVRGATGCWFSVQVNSESGNAVYVFEFRYMLYAAEQGPAGFGLFTSASVAAMPWQCVAAETITSPAVSHVVACVPSDGEASHHI